MFVVKLFLLVYDNVGSPPLQVSKANMKRPVRFYSPPLDFRFCQYSETQA